MQGKFHGVFSLILMMAAVAIALFYTISQSPGWGLVYLVIVISANPIVLYAYCAKCLCRENACSHVIPGKLACLLPQRKQGPYALADYVWTILALAALFGFPIPWLWRSKILFFGYLLLLLIGLTEILYYMCRTCCNENCPICPTPERRSQTDNN